MSRTDTLKSLEVVLESILERAVSLKTDRLQVLDGINHLDDIAGMCRRPDGIGRVELSDRVGDWFARHQRWINDGSLRNADRTRIASILDNIRQEVDRPEDRTPATDKILDEIKRWQAGVLSGEPIVGRTSGPRKITLRKGPETAVTGGVHPSSQDSLAEFGEMLKGMTAVFLSSSQGREHLMSVLSDALNSAKLQKNSQALLLAASIIYYLKQNGYMVEPFVKRLKEAERLQKGVEVDA